MVKDFTFMIFLVLKNINKKNIKRNDKYREDEYI